MAGKLPLQAQEPLLVEGLDEFMHNRGGGGEAGFYASLTFYDFPAEHCKHVRSSNPIESTFATVRLRTTKTKDCLSRHTAVGNGLLAADERQEKWCRLNGSNNLAEVIKGVTFKDGIKQIQHAA